jgi:hypothetical protein
LFDLIGQIVKASGLALIGSVGGHAAALENELLHLDQIFHAAIFHGGGFKSESRLSARSASGRTSIESSIGWSTIRA